ncbi:MAG: PAS domain S-box protein [Chloroflexota bacterium]|nr:PAS domain S-box protein [Chloroflexota bacterium]
MAERSKTVLNEFPRPLTQLANRLKPRFSYFMESSMDAFGLLDEHLDFISINSAAERLFKVRREDLVGKNMVDIIPAVKQSGLHGRLLDVIKTGRPFAVDNILPNLEFPTFYVNLKAFKIDNGLGVIASDVSEQKIAEMVIRHKLKFEETVSRISTRFTGITDIDGAINASLADIGVLSGAGRSYVFLINEDGITVDNTHEWCAEGVSAQIENLKGIPTEVFTWLQEGIYENGVIHIKDVSKLPDEADLERVMLEKQDIKSILMLPIHNDGRLVGIIGLDNVTETGGWGDAEMSLLRVVSGIISNALERKQTEERLLQEKAYTESIMDSVPDIVLTINPDTTFSYVNEAFCKFYGVTPDDILGKSLETLIKEYGRLSSEFEPVALERSKNRLQTGISVSAMELELVNGRGEKVPCTYSASGIKGPNGKILGEIVIIQDITERKKAESKLHRQEQYFRALIENSWDATLFVDTEGHILYESPSIVRMLGFIPEERLGCSIFEHVHPDDLHVATTRFTQLVHNEDAVIHVEARIMHRDGSWRTLEVNGNNLLNNPAVEGIVINLHDVTERKRAEHLIQVQRDLDMSLNTASGLSDGLRLCLEAALDVSDMDCGGIYLVDRTSGDFELVFHKGLPAAFVDAATRFSADSDNARLVNEGKPVHTRHDNLDVNMAEAERQEGLRAISIIPVFDEDRVVGSLNAASYTIDELPMFAREALEIMAIQIGKAVVRMQAEQALRESEEKLKTYMENSPESIFVCDSDGMILYINEATEAMIGYKREKVLGSGFQNLGIISPCHLAKALQMVEVSAGGMDPDREVIELNKPDGTIAFVEVTLHRVRQGEKVEFIGIARDITERKRAEEALKESEEYFRALIENSLDAIAILNDKGIVRYVSSSVERVLGYKAEELIGRVVIELLHADDIKLFRSVFRGFAYSPGRAVTTEGRFLHKDGTWRVIESVGSNLLNEKKVDGIIVNFRNITERKQAEQALQESEAHYRLLAENVTDVIWICDMKLRFTYFSPSITRLLGYSVEEALALRLEGMLPPGSLEDALKVLAEEAAIEKMKDKDLFRSRVLEVEQFRKDGSTIWTEVKVTLLRNEANKPVGMLGVTRDITERREAEEERQRLEEQLQLAGRLAAVGELAAGVAHELNNPLTAVQAFAQFLTARDDVDESIKRDVNIIYREAQRTTKITGKLLSFARREKPNKRLISINEAILESLELHSYRLRGKNIEMMTELDPELPMIMADFHQMQQVFVNIITNAEQAITEFRERGKLSIKTQKMSKMIRVTFADDGPGISEDDRDRIFDPFFTTKEVGKGTGLGLSICFGIIQEHGGHIYARSKLGKGATFVVDIPLVLGEQRIVRAV